LHTFYFSICLCIISKLHCNFIISCIVVVIITDAASTVISYHSQQTICSRHVILSVFLTTELTTNVLDDFITIQGKGCTITLILWQIKIMAWCMFALVVLGLGCSVLTKGSAKKKCVQNDFCDRWDVTALSRSNNSGFMTHVSTMDHPQSIDIHSPGVAAFFTLGQSACWVQERDKLNAGLRRSTNKRHVGSGRHSFEMVPAAKHGPSPRPDTRRDD